LKSTQPLLQITFLERERIDPEDKEPGGKVNNFSKTTHFKYDNIYKSLKGMNYPVMEKAAVIFATENTEPCAYQNT